MAHLAALDGRHLAVCPILHGTDRLCRSGTAMIFRPIFWFAVVLGLLWLPFLIACLIDAPM